MKFTNIPLASFGIALLSTPAAAIGISMPTTWEVRSGLYAHGIGGAEAGSAAIEGEIVTPRLIDDIDSTWSALIPRLHAGAQVNLSGKTSFLYAGATWTLDVTERLFVEGFAGGVLHDGETERGIPGRSALGCGALYSVGTSLGWRLTDHWSGMVTYHHLSNGAGVFGTRCNKTGRTTNPGFNQYGIRISRHF